MKKTLEPEVRKELANEISEEYEVSIARACKLMDVHRSYFYYESTKDDSEIEEAIREAAKHGEGFWKIFEILRLQVRKYSLDDWRKVRFLHN